MVGRATRESGERGERIAARYLVRNGFQILATNYRFHRNEIDLIASGEGAIVFVEVKLRRSNRFGPPEAAVDARKRLAILACARGFLGEKRLRGRPCRFDVIAIREGDRGSPQINHIRDAFRAGR